MAEIRDLTEADLPVLSATDGGNGWRGGDHPIWRQHLDERRQGLRDPLVAVGAAAIVGYVGLLWRSHARLGYVPDGRGVAYENAPTVPGQSYRLDDDLVLFMTKPLA